MHSELPPGNVAVAVVVQSDGKVEVAQRDVPLPAQVRAVDAQREVAVAGLVRERRGADEQREPDQPPHGLSAFSFAPASRVRRSS